MTQQTPQQATSETSGLDKSWFNDSVATSSSQQATSEMSGLDKTQKKRLRGLGHDLSPLVLVGKEGLTAGLVAATDAALSAHELVKVKLERNAPVERADRAGAAEALVRATNATLVQRIGRVVLLYRPNPELPEGRRITLEP